MVPVANRATTHYSPTLLDNQPGVLDVEGYVSQEVILDTGAVKVMFSKAFATAVGIKVGDLARGPNFVFVGGAVEVSIGVTKEEVEFILSRGTRRKHRVALFVTVVDTGAHCAFTRYRVYCHHGGVL